MAFEIEDGNGDPRAEKAGSKYGFIHVPARGKLRVCFLCEKAWKYVSHWNPKTNRHDPHDTQSCICKRRAVGTQNRWVYCVYDEDAKRMGILELGKEQAVELTDICDRVNGLRGLQFEFRKPDGEKRGRIEITLRSSAKMPSGDIPKAFDTKAYMIEMWTERRSKELVDKEV